jgi:hypothetical protein
MLTLAQLVALTDCYGADLERWPHEQRARAYALLARSPEARAILGQAASLDALLAAAGREADRSAWLNDGDTEAALVRLRTRVAARLDARARMHTLSGPLGWMALAAAASIAVFAGLLIGSRYTASVEPTEDSLLTVLQPVPIHLTAE